MEIKRPIIGEISLKRGKNKNMDIDYDVLIWKRVKIQLSNILKN